MTGETELLAVEQRHRDAASALVLEDYGDASLAGQVWAGEAFQSLSQAFARFERDHLARIAELEATIAGLTKRLALSQAANIVFERALGRP